MDIGIISAVGKAIYDRRSISSLPARRPRFVWLPKYQATIELPVVVLELEDPFAEVEKRLNQLGFQLHREHRHAAIFRRGHSWGDIKAELAGIELQLSLPLAAATSLRLEYSSFALFDTGDLWQLASHLIDSVRAADA